MAGTLTPTPYQTVLDGDGVAVSGAKIYTYVAGTTTNAATYTSSALSSANTNPIVADSAGRYVAYLTAGANLRFIIKTSADVLIDDQDNVQSVPGSSVNLDIEGTVGEAVTAGQVLYLSSAAESVPLTAGKWYLTDSDAAATSTAPQSIGVAVSAIAINTAGTIRLAGEVNSAGTVVVGTTYYVGATPGAIVSSAPAFSRQVGVGLTTSSLLLAATTAVASLLPNPITQDLLFVDATYDIGKSGASRPRDLFASRNTAVGGTLGVSGISTFTADLVATGASMSFQDDEGITLGTGADATLKFDATNVALDTQAVGSGLLIVTGRQAISGVEIDNTATDGDPTLAFTLSGTSLFTLGVDDGDSDKFKIGTTAIGTSTSLTIDGSQNVGINQTTPTHKLHVVGDIKLQSSQVHLTDGYGLLWGDNGINGNAATDSLRVDTAGAARLTIDSAGLVNMGNNLTVTGDAAIGMATIGDGTLHVQTATAGSVTAGAGADDLVVENSTHVGMTFLGPNGNYQQTIAFGDVADADSGRIVYDHNSNMLALWTEGTQRLTINNVGDFYSTAYTDYYGSSTIVGWSSLTAGRRYILTKRIGKTVFVWFHLEGTSNGTRCSFTLPVTSTATGYSVNMFGGPLSFTYNNGAAVAIQGVAQLPVNSDTCTVPLSPTAADGWTASGSKIIAGSFVYEGA